MYKVMAVTFDGRVRYVLQYDTATRAQFTSDARSAHTSADRAIARSALVWAASTAGVRHVELLRVVG